MAASTPCDGRIDDFLKARNYLKIKLGHPVVCVEVADEQLNQIICDTVQDASRYLYGEGNQRDYMLLAMTSGTTAYVLPDDVIDTVQFSFMSYLDGINVMHSPTNMLLYNDWANQRNYPGGPGSGGASIVNYDIAMMYFKEIQNQFKTMYNADYHEPSRTLYLTPTPKQDGVGMLEIWRRSQITDMLDHPIVKKIMVGRAMMQWGQSLGKYQIQMPGGGTTNGDTIYSRGEAMEEKWMEKLEKEGTFPQFFVG
jgi:hypothetical protein